MKQLKVADLQKTFQQRQEKRKESFNKVLEQCFKKVENCAKLNNIGCFFDVPEFIIGFPLFNLNECILYVYENLTKNGFQVQYIFPRILYITWFPPASQQSGKKLMIEHTPDNNTSKPAPKKGVGGRKKAALPVGAKSIAEFKPSGKFILNLS